MLPTAHPFLYYLWATVAEGKTLHAVEEATSARAGSGAARGHHRSWSFAKVRAQLRARFVYDGDSVTDIAHQLGYFETIASWRDYHDLIPRLDTVTLDQVNAVAAQVSDAGQHHHRMVRASMPA